MPIFKLVRGVIWACQALAWRYRRLVDDVDGPADVGHGRSCDCEQCVLERIADRSW